MINFEPDIVLFDLDRTLFDTSRFIDDLWKFLEATYGTNSQVEREKSPLYYRFVNEWYDYDFFRHMHAIDLMPKDRDEIVAAAKRSLRTSYLFEDALLVFDVCDEIITFGNEAYQSLKLEFSEGFKHKPVQYISEEKGEYIAREFSDRSVLLIDDKDLDQTLPADAWFIRIDRTQIQDCVIRGPRRATISTLEKFHDAYRTLVDLSSD